MDQEQMNVLSALKTVIAWNGSNVVLKVHKLHVSEQVIAQLFITINSTFLEGKTMITTNLMTFGSWILKPRYSLKLNFQSLLSNHPQEVDTVPIFTTVRCLSSVVSLS